MATEKKTSTSKAAKKPAAAPVVKQAKKASAEKKVESNVLGRRKELVGTVVSDKMQKTIVVKVDRRVRHGLYEKYVTRSVRFKAHDEKNTAKVGDLVRIIESRPLSRDKRWALKEIVRRAAQTLEIGA
ncbi:30S ribosomal protein S17 [bacterium]|nr:30S ribosomal protein S17 [bacterium]